MTIIRTTVDDKIYDSAADILSTLGMDVNAAVRMFLQGVVLHNGIPFDLRLTAEQVQAEYKSANRGQLPDHNRVVGYDTRFDPGAKVSPGGKMTVVSSIEVVQGSADPKPTLEEELTLIRPDGSEVKSRKKANENQGAGAYTTSYSMTMPSGVPQGVYPVKTVLYMNGQKVAGKDMSMQVVALPSGETVAFAR